MDADGGNQTPIHGWLSRCHAPERNLRHAARSRPATVALDNGLRMRVRSARRARRRGAAHRAGEAAVRDEASFIAELESAEGDELARRLTRPSAAEERDLVEYLGEPRYERMHDMALRRSARGGVGATQGNVVVIHGIMGSSLRSVGRRGDDEEVWLKALRLMSGSVARLRLEASGRAELDADWDVRPSGILQRHYGELLLSLSTGWRVRAFWNSKPRDSKGS